MKNTYPRLIVWATTAVLIAAPLAIIYYLININALLELAKNNLNLAIQWPSVTATQAYSFWALTLVSVLPALVGIYFLRKAFINFSRGEFFNAVNSQHLRRFSIFIFIQAIATPLHFSLSSLLLSFNHPAGQKMLSISIGSNEIKALMLAVIFWVISDLLVKASQLDNENKQFI